MMRITVILPPHKHLNINNYECDWNRIKSKNNGVEHQLCAQLGFPDGRHLPGELLRSTRCRHPKVIWYQSRANYFHRNSYVFVLIVALKYNAKDIPLHKVINAHDKDTYSILEYLDDCVEFVHRSREKTNVLVHCYAGVSRSVTIVLAYLMKKCNWNLQKALGFVRSKRVVAKPNDGFMRQLQQYEKQLQKNQVPKWTQ